MKPFIYRMIAGVLFLVINLLVFGEVTSVCRPPADTPDDCQIICENAKNCFYFTWNSISFSCYLKVRTFCKLNIFFIGTIKVPNFVACIIPTSLYLSFFLLYIIPTSLHLSFFLLYIIPTSLHLSFFLFYIIPTSLHPSFFLFCICNVFGIDI